MIQEIVVEIDWQIDRAREICRKANRGKKKRVEVLLLAFEITLN